MELGAILNSLFAFKKVCFNSLFVCSLKQVQKQFRYFYFVVLRGFFFFYLLLRCEKHFKQKRTIDKCKVPARTPSKRHRSLPRLWRPMHRKTMQPPMPPQAMRGLDLLHRRSINSFERKIAACISSCMSICI